MKEVHSAWFVAQGDPSQQIVIKTKVTEPGVEKSTE